ncbi:MAG: hypothetical protein HXX80_01090 [Nitrososphaerales archaeon]|nr:hypothetical protein [Nitrososphaerales archaeon]
MVDKKVFNIHMLRAKNGCFLTVSEGEEAKFGSIALSVKVGDRANSTIIIPSRFGDIYSRILAESISVMIDGVVIASLHTLSPIEPQIVRRLLDEIKELCKIEP